MIRRLDIALAGVHWEAIFVDDNSPDGTSERAKELALDDARIRCLRRVGRRGLAGACIEGMLSSSAPVVAVMDADLQHDERVLPQMLRTLTNERVDLVAATRYVEGGSAAYFCSTSSRPRTISRSQSNPMYSANGMRARASSISRSDSNS